MKFLVLFLLEFLLVLQITFGLNTLVNTNSGPIQGTTKTVLDGLVLQFLGIPYAEPPLGSQRFLRAKPVKPWTNTLPANDLPPACMQYSAYPFPWADDLPGKSEDCLYLNIYAPGYSTEGNNLPVMFWIHGGGYLAGSSRMEVYDASALALLGDVIVVTINYRLGVFGFLTSNTEDAPGNIGPYDMLMALRWVNENIEAFGGDKTRITLAGDSAGAISISLFCVSPLTKGLFSKAIMESGSAVFLTKNALKSNLEISQQVATVVGCASDTITIESDPESVVGCLRNQNSFSLAYAFRSLYPSSAVGLWPQYGDDLFPFDSLDNIRKGNFHNVALLIGNNRDEGSALTVTSYPDTFGFFGQKDPEINKTYASQVIVDILSKIFFDNPETYAKYYLDKVDDEDYYGIKNQTYTAIGDATFLCPTVYFAESFSERKNDVYFYFFVHRPSNTPWAPWMGVAIYEEVQFVFGRPILKPQLYNPDETELSMEMISIWTNFVKNGVPSNSFYWPKYSKKNHDFVYLDTSSNGDVYGTGPRLNNCNFLRDHYGF